MKDEVTPVHLPALHALLFSWWREKGRMLPWREKKGQKSKVKGQKLINELSLRDHTFSSYFAGELHRDPYRVVVSEVMLQQTQVDRVLPKYEHWMMRWPKIGDLAKATLAQVIQEWQGLGYNRRARFLWLLSKEIVEKRRGIWPRTEKELLSLPGTGKYTARAVLSFAFGVQVGVVDTNVKRVIQRVFDIQISHVRKESVLLGEGQKSPPKADPPWAEKVKGQNVQLQASGCKQQAEIRGFSFDYFRLADAVLPEGQADPWNQAIMDFGAMVCTAKTPECESCPVATLCVANKNAKEHGFMSFREQFVNVLNKESRGKITKQSPKDLGLKFEQTDRFLRGRVVDLLRGKKLIKKELIDILNTKFTQFNPPRIGVVVDQLIKEQMISESDGKLQLGDE